MVVDLGRRREGAPQQVVDPFDPFGVELTDKRADPKTFSGSYRDVSVKTLLDDVTHHYSVWY